MTETMTALREALIFGAFLMSPALVALGVCVWRGIKAEIRERRRR